LVLKTRKVLITVSLAIQAASSGWAQTAAAREIDALLAAPVLTYGQAARFVLEAAEAASTPGPEAAFSFAAERGWLPPKAAAGQTARLDGVSLLIMRAFDLKGGMLYSAAKNAHYAYRNLVYQKVIQGRADPAMPVSGEFLLFMTGRVMSIKENGGVTLGGNDR
jgi:hypothetical protein